MKGDDVEVCISFDVGSAVLERSVLKNSVVCDVCNGVEVTSSEVWETDGDVEKSKVESTVAENADVSVVVETVISAAVEVTSSDVRGTDEDVEKSKVESTVEEDVDVSVVVEVPPPEMFELRVLKFTVDVV